MSWHPGNLQIHGAATDASHIGWEDVAFATYVAPTQAGMSPLLPMAKFRYCSRPD